MHEQIKEHDRDIRLSQTRTSAISEHANKTWHHPLWDKVTFIDQDPHWYSRRVHDEPQAVKFNQFNLIS